MNRSVTARAKRRQSTSIPGWMKSIGFLLLSVLIVTFAGRAQAYHYPPDNVPPGAPPNYNQLDTSYFLGIPSIPVPPADSGGVYIYFHQGEWTVANHIYSKGGSLEQFHGSILAVLDQPPQLNVNVHIDGFELWADTTENRCLQQNDRWGWVQWGDNLFEIWWDVTTKEFNSNAQDINDILRISVSGCALDFNIWSSDHGAPFGPDQVYLGVAMTPLSSISEFVDTFDGLSDPYQSQAGSDPLSDPNITIFTPKSLPGESYNAFGVIQSSDQYLCDANYGQRYAGAFAYEGNGLQFATLCVEQENLTPNLLLPNDSLVFLCGSDSLCFTINGSDPDVGDSITLTLLEGGLNFVPVTAPTQIIEAVCFVADTAGVYRFIWQLTDLSGASVIDTVIFTVDKDTLVDIDDQSFFLVDCNLRDDRVLIPSYDNNPGDWIFSLLSGTGVIDSLTGVITYRPDTSGLFLFTVEASNSCGSDTAVILDSLILNQPPSVFGSDTTVVLCDVQEICIDIFSSDTENDPVTISQLEGLGTFTQLTDSTGQTCFLPADIDSAVYAFVYRATDSCVLLNDGNPLGAPVPCCLDTVFVTVLINQAPILTCPGPQTFFACSSDSLCFDISVQDDNLGSVTLNVLSGNASIVGNTVCVSADVTASFDVVIEAIDGCRSDTCTIPVSITRNAVPMVHTAADFSMSLCSPETICFAATADDQDFNLASASMNFGSYDAGTNRICFMADSSGVYTLILSAVDSCGAVGSDTTIVTVLLDVPPVVSLGQDFDALCALGEVCIPVTLIDNNISLITSNIGVFDTASQTLCFTPDTAGQYTVILQVSDDCGNLVADTVIAQVTVSNPPLISGFADSTVFLCTPEQICLPTLISDPGNDIQSITLNQGTYSDGQVCFVPFDSGRFEIILTVVDSCGNIAIDTAVIIVQTDQGVTLTAPADTSLFLCAPDTICIPVGGVPANATVTVGGTGVWWDEASQSVCFYSDCCLENIITVSATTPCATFSTEIVVSVKTNSKPLVILPPDSSILVCDLSPICFPVGISDIDGNLDSITVSGGTFDAFQNTICFTPDSSGVYLLSVQVIDSCGEVDSDSVFVTVTLNQPPVISYIPEDTVFTQCAPELICLSVGISDLEMNIDSIIVTGGSYDAVAGTICILPDGQGDFFASVVAVDVCGLRDSVEIAITVNGGDFVSINCPVDDFFVAQCGPGQVCLPLEITGSNFIVNVPGALWSNGQFCFVADSSGLYNFVVTAETNCGIAVCSLSVLVQIDSPAALSCPADQSVFLCAPDTLAYELTISGTVDSIIVGNGAFVVGDSVYVPVLASGQTVVNVTAFGPCGNAQCSFVIIADFNSAPLVQGNDADFNLCQLGEVCVPFTASDIDGNLDSIISSLGTVSGPVGSLDGSKSKGLPLSGAQTESGRDQFQVCFTPDRFGQFEIVLTAFDSCGATAVDTFVVNITQGDTVAITADMPVSPFVFCAVADSICWPITVSGVPDQVITSLGTIRNGQLCFLPDSAGIYTATVIGDAQCNSDTLVLSFEVRLSEPVTVSCQAGDTTISFCVLPDTVFLPLAISGTIDSLRFSPSNLIIDIAAGLMKLPVDSAGTISVSVVAFGFCNSDSCSFVLTVDGNVPPVVTLGTDSVISLCGLGEICLPFSAVDADLDSLDILTSLGVIRGDSVCFMADSSGRYEIILSATDPCGATSLDIILIDVILPEPVSIDLGPDGSRFICGDPTVCIPVALTGNSVSVITNLGSYSSANGQICFIADTAGIYTMIAEASDSCGNVATDTLLLDISFNNAPTIAGFADSSVFICSPTPVCLPVSIDDLDGNIASITVSRGQYENGQICFIPYNIGLQEIVLTVTDSCGLTTIDTAFVDVLTDQAVSITFPSDTSVFLCQADTLCFPVAGVPSDATVDVGGTNVWWDAVTQSVCFFSNCCLENIITVTVTTACGNQFSGQFTARVRTNSAPLAILPPDTAISQCAFEPVCFPVGISDADGNLMTVEVIGATFDAFQNTACLTPDTAGVYLISVIVTDSCGAVDRDDLFVTISLNQPPVISYTPIDTAIKQCLPQEVCIPVTVFDPDDNVVNINVIGGRYDSLSQSVCILPTGIGEFCAQIIVTDACGLIDSVEICINITGGDGTSIVCPVTTLLPLPICGPGQICVPLEVIGSPDSVISTLGNWSNDTLCFTADSSGLYTALVISYAQCNNDTCLVTVQVTVAETPKIVCPADTVVAVCRADTVCFDFSTIGTVDSVIVSAPAFISGGQVCVPVSESGVQTITMIAIGPCGLDSCSFDVTTIGNTPPVVDIISADFAIKQCQLSEICVPISINDVDGNIVDTLTSFGEIRNDSLCFTPSSFGTFALVLSAFDQCGAFTADTVNIQVIEGAAASITCPSSPQMATFCQPDTICIPVAISGADTVTVSSGGWYDAANGNVCIPVDSAGRYSILINASGFCGDDSCRFELQVSQGIAPNVSCPVTIDTTLCLSQPDSVCFPVTITGSGLTVTVKPAGRYENGIVCVPVSSGGQLEVTIIANGDCGVDSCMVTLNVTDNQAPLLTLPIGPFNIDFCPRDTVPFCLAGIFATDVDGSVTITQVCGAGEFEAVRADSGQFCFLPNAAGLFEFCFVATDGCRSDSGSIFINVTERADCDVCVTLALESDSCAIVGKNTRVSITANSNEAIGGFELLFSFDASALAFSQATIEGTSIETWEYFTWNLGGAGCGVACPSGLVRVVGIADQNDGPSHPPDSAFHPRGDLVFIDFRVANDQNLAGQFIPINWSWFDCNDNSISDPSGTILFVDNRIFGSEGNLLWDETDDVSFPESARPFGLGSPDDCFTGGGGVNPIRCLDFKQGGLCIGSGTAGNSRGDINLNGLAYEVGDAVLFTNFFITGLSVFIVDVAAQIAATDVNADGLTLTVADLVFLLRVITGDADPIPKIEPFAKPATLSLGRQSGSLTISGESEAGIGGMFLSLYIDPALELGDPVLGDDAVDMEFIYQIEGNEMRLLVYSMNAAQISPGVFDLISIPFTGEGEASLISAEAADYTGRPYSTNISSFVLPEEFALDQNYPNPFNPTTTISFSLPARGEWRLSIYNVVGKLVREYADESEAGVQNVVWDGRDNRGSTTASGVYFYRLTAGSFLQTKKMILLK